MLSLSLSPRLDLFRFAFPKDFIPKEIEEKYSKVLYKNPEVSVSVIDYLNESIKNVHVPGISDLYFEQDQHSVNKNIKREDSGHSLGKLGRINIEPKHTIIYKPKDNPLEKIEKEITVTFRMNQGLYNYFMLYETLLMRIDKADLKDDDDVLYIEILNGNGEVTGRIIFSDCHCDGLDGLDFGYDKTIRDNGDFSLKIKFNNIDFEFLPYIESV